MTDDLEDARTDRAQTDELRWEAVEEGVELLQTGDVEAALTELSRVVAKDAGNEYAQFFLGNVYFESKDFARALKCYVAALDVKPKYTGAMIAAGQTLRMLGDHERALRMAKQVLRIEPDDPDALFLLGAVHFQRGEHAQAIGPLVRFIQTRPEIEVAMEVEGMLQICRGEVEAPPEE